jgi:hypothetical protein
MLLDKSLKRTSAKMAPFSEQAESERLCALSGFELPALEM